MKELHDQPNYAGLCQCETCIRMRAVYRIAKRLKPYNASFLKLLHGQLVNAEKDALRWRRKYKEAKRTMREWQAITGV